MRNRQFEDNTELIFLSKNVDKVGEELIFINEKQDELKKNQIKIFAAIKLLWDIDDHLQGKNSKDYSRTQDSLLY